MENAVWPFLALSLDTSVKWQKNTTLDRRVCLPLAVFDLKRPFLSPLSYFFPFSISVCSYTGTFNFELIPPYFSNWLRIDWKQ